MDNFEDGDIGGWSKEAEIRKMIRESGERKQWKSSPACIDNLEDWDIAHDWGCDSWSKEGEVRTKWLGNQKINLGRIDPFIHSPKFGGE